MSCDGKQAHPAPWITFEGIEGSGKSTQLERLAARLRRAGIAPTVTREPGGTDLGKHLRALLLDPGRAGMDPMAELLLYAADRAQHVAEVVEPALREGRVVLCDRHLDATLAYQGYGRQLGVERILEIHRHPPLDRRPRRTLLFDLDPAVALARARRRNRERGVDETEGRFERERLDFHVRVREGYLALAAAAPERIRVLEAARPVDDVEREVGGALLDLLPALEDEGH